MNVREAGVLATIGRGLYAIGAVVFGVERVIYANLPANNQPNWFPKLPGAPLSEYAAGLIMVLCGAAIFLGIGARVSATCLGALLLLWTVLKDIAIIIADPSAQGSQNNACEAFAVCAGALIVARSLPLGPQISVGFPSSAMRKLDAILPLGRYLLAIAMMFFGYAHLRFAQFVATLVPGWMPWHLFWAYFCGGALLSAGIGIITGIAARKAAILCGIMISLFGVLLNIPLALTAVRNPDLWTSTFDVFAWSGACFVLAGCLKLRVSQAL